MMLDCYRIILCEVAVCDGRSNLCSYVNVQEAWTLHAQMFGENLGGVQVHFALAGTGTYEIRQVWVAADGSTSPAGDSVDTVLLNGRNRVMSPQVRVPAKPGVYDLMLEWRATSGATSAILSNKKWQRCSARAPISIKLEVAESKQAS